MSWRRQFIVGQEKTQGHSASSFLFYAIANPLNTSKEEGANNIPSPIFYDGA